MTGLEHVGICAKNTILLKEWYVHLFNWKIVYDNKKEMPTFFMLLEDKSMIEIYPMEIEVVSKNKKHQGIRHIALETDEIEIQYQNLLNNNVELIEELTESSNGVKTIWFKDIEGNILHFIQRPKSLY